MSSKSARVVLRVWSSTSQAARQAQQLFVEALGASPLRVQNNAEAVVLAPGVQIVWHTPEGMASQLRKLVLGGSKSAANYSTVIGAGLPLPGLTARRREQRPQVGLGPIFQAQPRYQCQLTFEEQEGLLQAPVEASKHGMQVHELALGLGSDGQGMDDGLNFFKKLDSTRKTRLPGLLDIAGDAEGAPLYVRLVPSNQSAIIVAPPGGDDGLEAALQQFVQEHKGDVVPLGKRGGGSIRHAEMYGVLHPAFAGLDVRFISSAASLSPCFPERSVTEDLAPELQSVHVNRGAQGADAGAVRSATLSAVSRSKPGSDSASAQSEEPQFLGDCWMEFRAMLRRPGGFFRTRH